MIVSASMIVLCLAIALSAFGVPPFDLKRRLTALGLSPSRAIGLLFVLETMAASAAIALAFTTAYHAAIIVPYAGLFLAVVTLFFLDRQFDLRSTAARGGEDSPAMRRLSLARTAIELCTDLMLAAAALFGALLIRFEFSIPSGIAVRMFESLPLIMLSTVAAFGVARVYRGEWRGDWRNITAADGMRFATASILAGAFAYAVSRFSAFVIPRTSCVIFVILVFNLLVATRWSSSLMLRLVRELSSSSRRAVLVGADVRGQAAIQHYLHAAGAGAELVGVIDDDHFMHGKFFHGYPVLGSLDDLDRIFERSPFDEILIVQEQMQPPQMSVLQSFALQRGVVLKRFAMSVSQLDADASEMPALSAT